MSCVCVQYRRRRTQNWGKTSRRTKGSVSSAMALILCQTCKLHGAFHMPNSALSHPIFTCKFSQKCGWKARDDIIIIIQRTRRGGEGNPKRVPSVANYFKFQPISNDFLSHMCGLHGGVWNGRWAIGGIGIASLVQIASSSDRRNPVDARRVFWLMLDACKSPNQFQSPAFRIPSPMRFDLATPSQEFDFSRAGGTHTLCIRVHIS